jgi:hypothetical protein
MTNTQIIQTAIWISILSGILIEIIIEIICLKREAFLRDIALLLLLKYIELERRMGQRERPASHHVRERREQLLAVYASIHRERRYIYAARGWEWPAEQESVGLECGGMEWV